MIGKKIMVNHSALVREVHFSAEEVGMETVYRVAMLRHDTIFTFSNDPFACVLWCNKNAKGEYFYGIFSDYYNKETFLSKKAFLQWVEKNDTSGFSVGAFNSIAEVNEDLVENNATAYGYFKEF